MKQLTPTIKGVITGLAMVAIFFMINQANPAPGSPLPYLLFLVYGMGIVWSVLGANINKEPYTFGALFNKGFKCFVVATLFISIAIFIYYKFHPEIIEQSAELTRQQLMKEKNRTPAEIEDMIKRGKQQYPLMAVSANVFQYLIIGAIVTAATAAILSLQKKK